MSEPQSTSPPGATGKLTPQQKKHLRGLAHSLSPVVRIGQKGLTESIIAETSRALEAHELIKVRIDSEDRTERSGNAEQVAEACGASLVGTIGKVAILYRPRPEKPAIKLPK